MRILLTIFYLLIFFSTKGQILTKEYIDNWIKQCDSSAHVELVKAYFISGEYFDLIHNDSAFRTRLGSIRVNQVSNIYYSKMKMDNYVPGEGTVGVSIIEKKTVKEANDFLVSAKESFPDIYTSFSQHILQDSKNPVLVIDGMQIHHTLVKQALDKIKITDIYDISVNTFFPVPATIYGQNAKNGLVQIWTVKKYFKNH